MIKLLTLVISRLLLVCITVDIYPQIATVDVFIPNEKLVTVVDKSVIEKSEFVDIDAIYPQMKSQAEQNKFINLNNKIEKWTKEWIDDIKLMAKEYYGNNIAPGYPFQAKSIYEVKYNKNDLLSFYIDYYQFTGGAHGITTRFTYVHDNQKGQILELKDIFKEGYDYKTAINKEIAKQIEKDKDKYFEGKEGFLGIHEKQKFYIEDDNLVIVYGLYEIAPYVAGIIEFRIPLITFTNEVKYDKIIS